jgi:integration host factor subunit beta
MPRGGSKYRRWLLLALIDRIDVRSAMLADRRPRQLQVTLDRADALLLTKWRRRLARSFWLRRRSVQTYWPRSALRVDIPKADGGKRPLVVPMNVLRRRPKSPAIDRSNPVCHRATNASLGRALTRSELIAEIAAANPNLRDGDVAAIVTTIFNAIASAIARGDRVELRGFGAFSVRRHNARVGRNPRNGEPIAVPEKASPFFRAGKDLRLRVDVDKVPKERRQPVGKSAGVRPSSRLPGQKARPGQLDHDEHRNRLVR